LLCVKTEQSGEPHSIRTDNAIEVDGWIKWRMRGENVSGSNKVLFSSPGLNKKAGPIVQGQCKGVATISKNVASFIF